jgi:hypothetical protein
MNYAVTSAGTAGSLAQLQQRIEDVGTLAGSTVTVSFYAQASLANLEIACSFRRFYGTGGSPSADEEILAYTARKTTSLSTTAFNRYSFSFVMPNIAGKTRGLAGNDSLILILWLDAGSTYNTQTGSLGNQSGTFYITGVQVEEGPGPSKFEERPRQVELALCQRYYEKTYALGTAPGTATSTGVYIWSGCTDAFGFVSSTQNFRVTKRSSAYSLSFFDTAGAAVWAWQRSGASGTGAVTAANKSETNFYCYVSAGGAYVAAITTGHWVASDEL